MYEPLHLSGVDHMADDRIHDLYVTASELRVARRPTEGGVGMVARTRSSVGRRLITIGIAVSGPRDPMPAATRAGARR